MKKLLFLLAILAAIHCSIAEDSCQGKIDGKQGELRIGPNSKLCEFDTSSDSKDITLDTDGLILTAGDKVTITSKASKDEFNYEPPTDAGYIHIGEAFYKPKITFSFPNGSRSDMVIRYSTEPTLPINVDINHNFKIINVGDNSDLVLKFSKTLKEAIHIEVSPPELTTSQCVLGNCLMNDNESESTIVARVPKTTKLIHVKTDIVLKDCSNTFSDLKVATEITGPVKISKPYQCVNLFKLDKPSEESHFDVDFANFLSLAADTDELIVRDSSRRLFIDRSSESSYSGKKISTTGSQLVIIYRAPDVSSYSLGLGLKLTIIPQSNGGIVRQAKDITFPANIPTIYTLIPNESKCINLQSSQAALTDGHLNITTDGTISKFEPNALLTPIYGSPKEMIVSYSGKTQLKFSFSPDGQCCNQLTAGRFSVVGGQPKGLSCYWTLASGGSITFDENNLSPGGCVTVQPLNSKTPMFSRCNIGPNEVIPRLVVSQAYVNVTMPNKSTKLTAFVSSAPTGMLIFDNTITASGYPISYPVATNQETYVLNATQSNFLIHVKDVDLRTGEKLQIGNLEVKDKSLDVLLSDAVTNITLTRPAAPTDFGIRRGFQLEVLAYNTIHVLTGNLTSNNSISFDISKQNLIKITSDKARYRVNYIISTPDTVNLHLYDGASISAPSVPDKAGSTTSPSLLITASSAKNATVKIQYWYTACEADALPCDNNTRCIPREFQCKGKYYCTDGSDMKQVCNSTGPPPPPSPLPSDHTGVGGFTVFILCILMLTLGVLLSTYGPGLYRTLEDRFRGSGQYNSFTSVE